MNTQCAKVLTATGFIVFTITSTIPATATRHELEAATCGAHCKRNRFRSSRDPIPAGWTGPIFQLSQDYPDAIPAPENYPWKAIDYKTQPMQYLMAVRNYLYEGNVNASDPDAPWVLRKNPIRKWYNAPWMDTGRNGREFIHGLTRELASRPGQLWKSPPQTEPIQNWAIGFYNPPGGYIVGQVWCDPGNPDLGSHTFPDGTVSAKLLFSAALPSQVPFLKNSVQWTANINTVASVPTSPRRPRTVRLLQIDVAVRETRNLETGWVFGTFIYDPDMRSRDPWEDMRPVGLMWGNDPGVTPTNGLPIKQTWLNPEAAHLMQHYGWAGRLNGPVDNPQSSCFACHATAGWPNSPLSPPNRSRRMEWFRNVKGGEPFQPGQSSFDYSLQLAYGVRQFERAAAKQ
ncbi:MAG TPA: hypothetical protein VJX67_27310 [Blastocatellia bacterium]|nr:hypothetical protein [Blastocatellia bacterium]